MTEDTKKDVDVSEEKKDESPDNAPMNDSKVKGVPADEKTAEKEPYAPPFPQVKEDDRDTVKKEYKPYYKPIAKRKPFNSFILWLLFIIFGLSLLGLGIQTFVKELPFRIEAATIFVVCFALIGLLWNKISMEAKVGLEAISLGKLLFIANTVYGVKAFTLIGLPGFYFLPAFTLLMLLAVLVSVWWLWPRFFWLPIILTVILLYTWLDPILALFAGKSGMDAALHTPGFMSGWPVYVQSGWIMAQVILPLGFIFFLALQIKNWLRPAYQKHWGFFFWAFCLIFIWMVSLSALERDSKPVFPHFAKLATQFYPITLPEPKPAEPTEPTEPTEPAEPSEPAEPASAEPKEATTPEPEPTSPTPATLPETAVTSEPAPAPATEPEAAAEPEPTPAVTPAAPIVPAETSPDLGEVKARITKMEKEITQLKARIENQDRLIRSLMGFLFSSQGNLPFEKMSGPTPNPGEMAAPPVESKTENPTSATAAPPESETVPASESAENM